MSTEASVTTASGNKAAAFTPEKRFLRRRNLLLIAGVVLVAAMALDTKVVIIGSSQDLRHAGFSSVTFGIKAFPKIQAGIEARAVDAKVLADAIAADKKAAGEKYGIPGGVGPVFSVKFTGVAQPNPVSGVYTVKVPGMPQDIMIRVQTGPAINGTAVRDATGTIKFGQFTNQIEYQDAGSALNNEVKKEVLASIDTAALAGKTISVTGAFQLINPKGWLVTPVRLEVK